MAQPLCVIEHFIRLFLGQWQCGLQPNLSFKTNSNGVITVDFNVSTVLQEPLIEGDHGQRPNRRSGRGSRCRRQKRRSQSPGIRQHNEDNKECIKPSSQMSSFVPLAVTSDQFIPVDKNVHDQAATDNSDEPSGPDFPCHLSSLSNDHVTISQDTTTLGDIASIIHNMQQDLDAQTSVIQSMKT